MTLTPKEIDWPNEHTFARLAGYRKNLFARRKAAMTPEQLYDHVAKKNPNVAIVKMGDTWVYGRMIPLAEVDGEVIVRRLGDVYGIAVMEQSTDWEKIVKAVLG